MKQQHEDNQKIQYANYIAWTEDKYYLFKVYKLLKKFFKLKNKKNIVFHHLDIGCADGSFIQKCKEDFGCEAFGIDVSEGAIKLANTKGIDAKVHNCENELPFTNNSFEVITCCEVIEHLYDTDFFMSEVYRVLKQGGKLFLTTPNLASLSNRIKLLFGLYPNFVPEYKIGAGHIRAYTSGILKRQLTEHGFIVEQVTSPNFTCPMKFVPNIVRKIAILMGDFFPNLGGHLIVVAKK